MADAVKTIWVGKNMLNNLRSGLCYYETEEFIKDLENGVVREGFILDEEVFLEMIDRLNRGDKELAGKIVEYGMLIVINAGEKSEINGLIELAELCCADKG